MSPEEQLLIEERFQLKQAIEFYEKNPELKRIDSAAILLKDMKGRLKEVVQQLMSFSPSSSLNEQQMRGFATREDALLAEADLSVKMEADPLTKGKFSLSVPQHPDPILRRYFIHATPLYDHGWSITHDHNVVTLVPKKTTKR
jgi:hypothetical protein